MIDYEGARQQISDEAKRLGDGLRGSDNPTGSSSSMGVRNEFENLHGSTGPPTSHSIPAQTPTRRNIWRPEADTLDRWRHRMASLPSQASERSDDAMPVVDSQGQLPNDTEMASSEIVHTQTNPASHHDQVRPESPDTETRVADAASDQHIMIDPPGSESVGEVNANVAITGETILPVYLSTLHGSPMVVGSPASVIPPLPLEYEVPNGDQRSTSNRDEADFAPSDTSRLVLQEASSDPSLASRGPVIPAWIENEASFASSSFQSTPTDVDAANIETPTTGSHWHPPPLLSTSRREDVASSSFAGTSSKPEGRQVTFAPLPHSPASTEPSPVNQSPTSSNRPGSSQDTNSEIGSDRMRDMARFAADLLQAISFNNPFLSVNQAGVPRAQQSAGLPPMYYAPNGFYANQFATANPYLYVSCSFMNDYQTWHTDDLC